jgi:hypothetical protein
MSTSGTSNAAVRSGGGAEAGAVVVVGRALSGVAALFLLFDGAIKALQLPPAMEATTQLGYAPSTVLPLGVVELVCLAIYLWPRTAVLGALLFAGYLGGAIATHVHNGSSPFQLIFPALLGALLWGGLLLREHRLRALIPLR